MNVHIGDCDHCPRKQVRIFYGWTHLTPNKHCQWCDADRKKADAKLKGKSGFMVAPETDAHKEKRAALAEIKSYLMITGGHVCEECGDTKGPLDLSHLLSQGSHPELSEEIENCVLHCGGLDKCHAKWENGTLESKRASVTFSKHRSYIQKHSVRL